MTMKFDHVGVAVRNVDQMLAIYGKIGDFQVKKTEVPGQKARIAMLRAGETSVEFLEPTSEDSALAKFIRERGEGLHHIAFEVDDIERQESPLCISGQVLKGLKKPHDCPAFGKECDPQHPLGATMVTSMSLGGAICP